MGQGRADGGHTYLGVCSEVSWSSGFGKECQNEESRTCGFGNVREERSFGRFCVLEIVFHGALAWMFCGGRDFDNDKT
eukprot:15019704-Ditylum_brightwellii.AAC.1